MLKLTIKSTFEIQHRRMSGDEFIPLYHHIISWKFVDNRKVRVTFYSRSFRSCRIFRICIFIISSRGYITCPDRWPGSQVPAGYKTSYCKLSFYLARVRKIMRLYWRDTQFRTKEISPPRHLGLCARLLSLSSCTKPESACQFPLLKIDPSQDLNTLNGAVW